MGASCFLKAHSSVMTGAEQPARSALWSLVTEVNITLVPGSAGSPPQCPRPHQALHPPTTNASAGSSPSNARASGPKLLSIGRPVYPLVTPLPPNSPSTARSFLLHRRWGERARLQRGRWEASLQSCPEQGLAYQKLQRHISAQGMALPLRPLPAEIKYICST